MNCTISLRGSTMLRFALAVTAWLGFSTLSLSAEEQTFDTLQIGTRTYTNVTVTTKTKTYVFIVHSQGMTNLKLAELPGDVLVKLGYEDPSVPKVATNGPAAWAKQTVAKLDSPEVKKIEEEIQTKWAASPAGAKIPLPKFTRNFIYGVLAGLVAFYFFSCFCCMLICKKAYVEPGILIWIPLLQLFPLLKAAKMSGWWFLAFFVPVLNIVAQILWCFKIADARGKTGLVGFLLWFPLTSFFAFLYLAFSNGAPAPKPAPRIEMMTLETP